MPFGIPKAMQAKQSLQRHGIRFQTRMLELIRKYQYAGEERSKLYRAIRLRPNHIVVDVGAGTGAYSRVIAAGLRYEKGGQLIGIDRNRELLSSARSITRRSGLSKLVSFKKGDARSIPLPDNFADRVVGQAFLYLFDEPDRKKVIKEMIRVCKPGGQVSVSEGAVDTHLVYIENNPRLTELWKIHNQAVVIGYKKYHKIDRNIGYKLPSILKKLGLRKVRLHVSAHAELLFDDRMPIQNKKDILEYWDVRYPKILLSKLRKCKTEIERKKLVERVEPAQIAGGMKYNEIIEFSELRKSRAETLIRHSALLDNDTSVSIGTGFLTTGTKV